MRAINTREILRTTKGIPVKTPQGEPVTFGDVISDILINHKIGGKMKCYVLAQKFTTEGTVYLDEADLELVKEAIKVTEHWNALVAQILIRLEETKDEKKEEKAEAVTDGATVIKDDPEDPKK